MNVVKLEREIAGRTLTLETGRVAKQAHGAVLVQYGDTVVLSTVLTAPPTRDINFFPLYVDYRENQYAAGKVPGGFFKREGRPSTKEVLTCRMIDRPIRPLFPYDFMDEVQVQCMVLSTDNENDPDMLAIIGASAALTLSKAPFDGPIGTARIGYVDGEYVVNPTHSQLNESLMDLLVCGPAEAINMIELASNEISEDIAAGGLAKGFETYQIVIEMINELAEKAGVEKQYEPTPVPDELMQLVRDKCGGRIREGKQIPQKVERSEVIAAIREELLAELCPEDVEAPQYTPMQVKEAFYRVEGEIQREMILSGKRPDGRAKDAVRPLGIDVAVLPRTHGSALFARGETQALVTATLGTPRDQQIIDGLLEEYKKPFILHYNFPPFCVGEIRPIRGPGRREIGHGALAEKSLQVVMPPPDQFPYTVRVVADMLESNGSTSMATVCGGTLALMDAGVPIRGPVAGISIGMVSDGEKYVLLTDIVGEEDFHGDMDFKVAGTPEGITGIQLDMKARGLPQERVPEVLEQARLARMHILGEMGKILAKPRDEISSFAPRMLTIRIDPEKIGKVIGPGGKTIKKIQEETGANIDIEDDGTVFISCVEVEGAQAAFKAVEDLTEEVELGKVYEGTVVSVRDFGAFIEILPGQDGLCHVSELDTKFVKNVDDVCKVGDVLKVKVINIDDQGRVKLSHKATMEGADDSAPKTNSKREPRSKSRR
ncbi:MAG: polyribonucleotide nucleotidyltransferase [Planctomycetota bacterium]|jgi:polyribonucleotide nucleotidyltransferase